MPDRIARQPKHIRSMLAVFGVVTVGVFVYYLASLLPMFSSAASPTLTTGGASNIGRTTVKLTGDTTSNGGSEVTEWGFQYGTTTGYGTTASETQKPYAFASKIGGLGTNDGEFTNPYGVAFDSTGNMYVVDATNNRIQKFDSNGNFITKWGSSGSGDGQFSGAYHIALDSSDNVFVVDMYNARVQKFNSSGTFISKFGTQGSGDGQFSSPSGIVIDSSNNIYVADRSNQRIQKFNSSGVFITKWGSLGDADGQFRNPTSLALDGSGNIYIGATRIIHKYTTSGVFVTKWGSAGTGNGQFNGVHDLKVDGSGNIVALDGFNYRVQIFDSSGTYLSQWGERGDNDGQFQIPYGLAIRNNDIYIADNSDRVQKFSPYSQAGTYTISITGLTCGTTYHYRAFATNIDGTSYGDDATFDTFGCAPVLDISTSYSQDITQYDARVRATINEGSSIATSKGFQYGTTTSYGQTKSVPVQEEYKYKSSIGSVGTGDGQFQQARNFAFDSAGNMYVADTYNDRIQVFNPAGSYVSQWGVSGSGPGQLTEPAHIAIGPDNTVYIAYGSASEKVQRFTVNGTYLGAWGTFGSGNGEFSDIGYIAVDSTGNVYVADLGNYRIQKFTSTGSFITKWGSFGSGDGQFTQVKGIDFDSSDNVYVLDYNTPRVQKFNSSGTFISKFGSLGSGDGQFSFPADITIDDQNNIFVLDAGNRRVVKFDPSGNYITKFSRDGASTGELELSTAIGVKADGVVYVADTAKSKIISFETVNQDTPFFLPISGLTCNTTYHYRAFLANGTDTDYGIDNTFTTDACPTAPGVTTNISTGLTQTTATLNGRIDSLKSTVSSRGFRFGTTDSYGQTFPEAVTHNINYTSVLQTSDMQSPSDNFPRDIARDLAGNMYVIEWGGGNPQVEKFDSNGNFITKWGSYGTGDGQFSLPDSIEVDAANRVYVADAVNGNIQKFDSNGNFISKWGTIGSGMGEFGRHGLIDMRLAIDSQYNIYVSELGSTPNDGTPIHRVQKFTNTGTYLGQWGGIGTGNGTLTLNSAADIAIDDDDYVYIVDDNGTNPVVKKFDVDGNYITEWGSVGSADGQFGETSNVRYIDIDSNNDVFVAEISGPNRVQKFDRYGNFLTKFGSSGSGNGQLNWPSGMIFKNDSTIVVSDHLNNRLQLFNYETVSDSFTKNLTGLTCGTTYHYQAYATNGVGTEYGSDQTFTTDACPQQTDFALEKTMTNAVPVNSGDDVNYHFKITNVGASSASYSGQFTDVLPAEFTLNNDYFDTLNNAQVSCVDGGLAEESGDAYLAGQYAGHHVVGCNIDAGLDELAPGEFIEFDLSGAANANYTNASTKNRSLYYTSLDNEDDVLTDVENAIAANQDMFELATNNVSTHTYSFVANTAPVVAIVNPDEDQQFNQGEVINLAAEASDSDGTITEVEFYLNSQLVGSVSSQPYEIQASGLAPGVYTVVARAIDNDGAATSSAVVNFTVVAVDPSVTTVSATSVNKTSAILNGDVTVIGSTPLTQRGFQYGTTTSYGSTVGNATSQTGAYSVSVSGLTCGTTYHYRAIATNTSGTGYGVDKTFTTSVCPAPPTVVITAPTNNQVFGAKTTSVSLAAVATSLTSEIARVEFFVDGAYVGTVVDSPYTMDALGLSVGQHILETKAYDVLGATAEAVPVPFYVAPPTGNPAVDNPPTTPPVTTPPAATPTVPTDANNTSGEGIKLEKKDGFSRTNVAGRTWVDAVFAHKVFSVVPWILILLLLILAAAYAYRARREYVLRKQIIQTLGRYQKTLDATDNYLALTAHHLNTPLAIMNGSAELVVAKKALPTSVTTHAQAKLKDFSIAIGQVLSANQVSEAELKRDQQQATAHDIQPRSKNPLKDRAVWLPMVVVFGCLVLANLLFIRVGVLSNGWVRMLIEFGLFVLTCVLLVLSYMYHNKAEAFKLLSQQQLAAQGRLMTRRRQFIADAHQTLNKHLEDLKLSGARFAEVEQGKLYQNGLAMLQELVGGMNLIYNTTNMTSQAPLLAVGPILEQNIKNLESFAQSKHVQLSNSSQPNMSVHVPAEALSQLLHSTIHNAIKFSKENGLVKIAGTRRGKKLIMTVTDTGVGISKDKLDKLFQPFTRATDTETFDYDGLGLNLYINKVILARLGGDIHIKSTSNKGTKVTVTLPEANKDESLVAPAMIFPTVSS